MVKEDESPIDLSKAPYALQTYYGYVASWFEKCYRLYGNDDPYSEIKRKFEQLTATKKMQGGQALTEDITPNYCRGKLTLEAMQKFPVSSHKELSPTANLWLPVQAYYAIHGVGISCILCLGQSIPTSHKAFRASFADLAGRHLPEPFSALCGNGPDKTNFTFENLDTTPRKVSKYSNLSNPRYGDIDAAIGKCLSSTRYKILDDKYSEARTQNRSPRRKRRNLGKDEKQSICKHLHKSSVVDFLYRMRIRSNYEEPDIFLLNTDADEAAQHYSKLVSLTKVLVFLLERIIEKKLGRSRFDNLTGFYRRRTSGHCKSGCGSRPASLPNCPGKVQKGKDTTSLSAQGGLRPPCVSPYMEPWGVFRYV